MIDSSSKPQARKVEAYGVKGLNSKPWRRTFASQAAFEKWMDNEEGRANITLHGARDCDVYFSDFN